MMKIRGYYEKIDRMRFIGHLDLLKLFQRAIARAKIPVAYSKGFNPHQLVGFALPLSTGYAGLNEIIEIELLCPINEAETAENLNKMLPDGLRIKEFITLSEGEKKAASLVCGAVYKVSFPKHVEFDMLEEILEKLNGAAGIIVKKDDGAVTDIKPLVSELKLEDSHCVELICAAGSSGSVKPEYVIKAIIQQSGADFERIRYLLRYTRTELLLSRHGES